MGSLDVPAELIIVFVLLKEIIEFFPAFCHLVLLDIPDSILHTLVGESPGFCNGIGLIRSERAILQRFPFILLILYLGHLLLIVECDLTATFLRTLFEQINLLLLIFPTEVPEFLCHATFLCHSVISIGFIRPIGFVRLSGFSVRINILARHI